MYYEAVDYVKKLREAKLDLVKLFVWIEICKTIMSMTHGNINTVNRKDCVNTKKI